MKKKSCFIFLLLLAGCASNGINQAHEAAPGARSVASGDAKAKESPAVIRGDEKQISILTDFFKTQIHTLHHPVFLYHWLKAPLNTPLHQLTSARDPQGFQYFLKKTNLFWANYGTANAHDQFGVGLYTATDPELSREYGGNSQEWILLQLHVDSEFKFLRISEELLPVRVVKNLEHFDCHFHDFNSIFDFSNHTANLSPKCRDAITVIFKERLAIDALSYNYVTISGFDDCTAESPGDGASGSKEFHSDAFIILNSSLFPSSSVKIFNSQTVDDVEDRTEIQSLIYRSALSGPKTSRVCGNIIEPIRPSVLDPFCETLWNDLAGKSIDLNIGNWIGSNLYGCVTPK